MERRYRGRDRKFWPRTRFVYLRANTLSRVVFCLGEFPAREIHPLPTLLLSPLFRHVAANDTHAKRSISRGWNYSDWFLAAREVKGRESRLNGGAIPLSSLDLCRSRLRLSFRFCGVWSRISIDRMCVDS